MTDSDGFIVPSFDRGSVLLVSGHQSIRAVWTGEKKPVPIPAGEWHIRNYKIERKHEGVEWILSGSHTPGPTIVVKDDQKEQTKIEIDDTVRLNVQVRRMHGKLHFGFGITGHEGMGLSVIKDEARPVPKWEVSAGGEKLGEGDCRYG